MNEEREELDLGYRDEIGIGRTTRCLKTPSPNKLIVHRTWPSPQWAMRPRHDPLQRSQEEKAELAVRIRQRRAEVSRGSLRIRPGLSNGGYRSPSLTALLAAGCITEFMTNRLNEPKGLQPDRCTVGRVLASARAPRNKHLRCQASRIIPMPDRRRLPQSRASRQPQRGPLR